MESRQISDGQWERIEGFLPGRPDSVGVTAKDIRLFVDGVLWCCAAARNGRTCRQSTASGRQPISTIPAGPGLVFGRRSFRCCWMIRITGM